MEEQELEFGSEYHLWREGNYIGKGVWTDDPDIGENFISQSVASTGDLINEVYIADSWTKIK